MDVFVIREILGGSGVEHSLQVAGNGQEALRCLDSFCEPSQGACLALVLLDLNLPKIGGLEVLKQIRENSKLMSTPVIVVTSSAAEVDRNAARNLGATAYFEKPRELDKYMDLARLVREVLTTR